MKKIIFLSLTFCFIFANDLEFEKEIASVNKKLFISKQKLQSKYLEVNSLRKKDSSDEHYKKLLSEINKLKEEISQEQTQFRKKGAIEGAKDDDPYAYWDQGETTLSQLIMEYGATEYLYVIPYELGSMKMDMFSSIPIPKESWQEMLQLILSQNGIGVKKLNPYLRQLFILKHDLTNVDAMVHTIDGLKLVPDNSFIFYVFSPKPEQLRTALNFFERFSDPKQTTIQIVGSKIVIIATKDTVEKLVNLYSVAWDGKQEKVVKLITSAKIKVDQMEKILKSFFQDGNSSRRPTFYQTGGEDLVFIPQGGSLAIIGEQRRVDRAEEVIRDLEKQIEDPMEMCISWYTCKHSDPEDIAKVLDMVYVSLISNPLETDKPLPLAPNKDKINERRYDPYPPGFERSQGYIPTLPVTPLIAEPGKLESTSTPPKSFNNFIVDPKTGSILMVIRRDSLPKIKTLLKRLDVPKKMAQIDVLLVEKKIQDRKQTGINLLKIGDTADSKKTGVSFDTNKNAIKKGILEFLIGKGATKGFPAFDLALNFLMSQDDIRVNASPSITAVNQTPATISIVEELSINNGAIQLDTVNGVTVEKSYTRAQFGITLLLTPTIHLPDENDISDDKKGYVTLQSDITFDTAQESVDDRPPVARRHLQNEVRVGDGETIIVGGLKKKSVEDIREKIPFLGDIPGIGKLFGTTKLSDNSTEIFIFITPHIIKDPIQDVRNIRQQTLKRRAGDLPEFMQKIEEAKELKRKKLFQNSFKLLFDSNGK
jgi:general secretion pathway protein D